MNEFAIGKLVIARKPNLVKGFHSQGDKIVPGMSGEIVAGPYREEYVFLPTETFWDVDWADGTKTTSSQKALLVIGDKGNAVADSASTDKPATVEA